MRVMADPTIIAVLTVLHIASAIGWLGAVVFFLSVIGPSVRKLTPAASLEFLTKVGPRQIRYFVGTATSTIVFGLALLFTTFGTDYTSWPRYIEAGFSFGLLAYLIALIVAIPSFRGAEKIAHQIMSNPQAGPPPPELARYLKRGNQAAISVVVILVLALVFMVLSAVFA
jgi:hypothetical protein